MSEVKRYGPLDVKRHTKIKDEEGVDLRVFLNGKEVTNRCTYADDIAGYVMLLKLNELGAFYIDPVNRTDVARETVYGDVRILERVHA